VLRLRVPISGNAAPLALDRLLPVAPLGVHELTGAFVLHAEALPPPEEMCAALGVEAVEVEEVPDAAAERLRELARPEPVDGRLLVRASWMAPLDGVEEVVLADASAFGTGAHPTTRDCLSILLALEPGGAFADLGCGAGVLAVAAAKLGWEPVTAVDIAPRAVEATLTNAEANGTEVFVAQCDLLRDPPPARPTVAANVPVEVHVALAAAWEEPPDTLIVSGVHADERDFVAAVYAPLGLAVVEERSANPWTTLLLRRGAPELEPGMVAMGSTDEPPEAEVPESTGERHVELGARAALFDLPDGMRFDVWALDDSMRWALRGPAGTSMEVLDETRLPVTDAGPGRPPSTVRLRLRITTPAAVYEVVVHVTIASAEPGLVRIGGSASVIVEQQS
jgi:ribosomal protein L11 methyltransferase